MAIVRVQTVLTDNVASGGATKVLTIPAGHAPTAGNKLRLCGGFSGGASVAPVGITDSKGNTWNVDKLTGTGVATGAWTLIASCDMANPLLVGDTLTVSFLGGGSPGFSVFFVFEYSGIALVNSLDQTNGATNTSTAPDSGPVTLTQINELMLGVCCASTATDTHTPGGGWTQIAQSQTSVAHLMVSVDEQIPASVGPFDHTGTLTGTGDLWTDSIATYKAAPTGGGNTLRTVIGAGV